MAPASPESAVTVPLRHPEKLLRLPRVEDATALKKSTIYAGMRDGTFPTPVRLAGGRAVAWRESEVQAWIAARTKTGCTNDGA
ncbi:MAG: AlpA family transcriptional regulator [Acidovorax sp.]|nr:AlpA family transcriptional regulator [Acidovorax sp.]